MDTDLIKRHGLRPHPEGGHYRETVRLPPGTDGRSRMTAILYYLAAGERSHWHRVDADELWMWHSGEPLILRIEDVGEIALGGDAGQNHQLQALVPAGKWQSAEARHGAVLTSCVVTPGFEFTGFELAAPDWTGPAF